MMSERHPDRLDLDASTSWFRPVLGGGLRQTVRAVLRGGPSVPPGEHLAPSPRVGDPVLGHLRAGVVAPLLHFPRWRREAGDIARLRLGGVCAHLISHPQHVRWVLQEANRRFQKPIEGRRNLSHVLGNGLLVSEGEFWLRQRRIAQPAFQRARVARFAEAMVNAAEELAADWSRRAERGRPFDVARDMMRLTLRVVQETLFGTRARADSDRVGDAVTVVLEDVNRRFRRLFVPPPSTPLVGNPRFVRAKRLLDDTVQRILSDRRRGRAGEDLLGLLLDAKDGETGESMSDRQLRDEVMTMFLAGHETTANALSWTFYLLGRHPQVASAMRDELRRVLGQRRVTAADYPELMYTRAVFQEAMRLYPPAWIIARAPIADETLGGYFVPAGSRIFISPWVIHRHPDLWVDPEAFDPRRFIEPSEPPDRFAYLPFGAGPRVCIGHRFAMMEGVLLLATLARRTHLELVPGHPVEPEALITLRPKHGVEVVPKRL